MDHLIYQRRYEILEKLRMAAWIKFVATDSPLALRVYQKLWEAEMSAACKGGLGAAYREFESA
jgi:hypothetical protein